jgi:hypothetical protein
MSSAKIWLDNPIFNSGSSTPFGIYDADLEFRIDAPKIAKWCARRLGYPIVDIELQDENFFAVFEEAVSEYSAQVNQFNIRNNLGILTGQSTEINFSGKSVNGSEIMNTIQVADTYGSIAGVGGNVDLKKGWVDLQVNKQIYDLKELWMDVSESGERISVTRVFYEAPPAIQRFFDPYSISGQGTLNLIDEFGFGSFSPAAQFILMPIYEDLLRIQHIEFNDQIRKSAHSFNIVNNNLEIFPIPTQNKRLWFEYMVDKELRENNITVLPGVVSDYSNVGYDFYEYSNINDVGKQWIRKYTLALAKEMLGAIREKYNTIPIPGSEVSLDGAALRAEASTEKDLLIQQLRENLLELSRKQRMQNEAEILEHQQKIIGGVPLPIFIG